MQGVIRHPDPYQQQHAGAQKSPVFPKKKSLNCALHLNYKKKSYPNISWVSFRKNRRIFLYKFRYCFILMVMLIGCSQFPSWLLMISYNKTYNLCLPDIHKSNVYVFCFKRFVYDVFVQIHNIIYPTDILIYILVNHTYAEVSISVPSMQLIRVIYCKLKLYSSNPQGI